MHDGYGMLLKKGTKLRVNMHYNKEPGPGTGFYDQTEIGFFFYPEGPADQRDDHRADQPVDFEIPPGKKEWTVGMAQTFDRPFTVFSHAAAHARARRRRRVRRRSSPTARVEQLLEVPKYDYNWQISYEYPEPRHFPAGTRIEVQGDLRQLAGEPVEPRPRGRGALRTRDPEGDGAGLDPWAWDDEMPAAATGGGR